MKIIKQLTAIAFSALLLVPVFTFNRTEDAISDIDNRKLAGNPFSAESAADDDFTKRIENYVNDRIGFRNEMIRSYTVLNDRLFHKMVHPSYSYGKDGYVFGAGVTVNTQYGDFHEAFADMVKQIQDYCDERNVPFLFVFNPAKPAILSDYIADGINYDRNWVDQFLQALDERGVCYLDNTVTLQERNDAGEVVYNKKYDANHWNDLGAYYGTNAMLRELQKDIPQVHVNQPEEFSISYETKDSLLVSEFPINEQIPVIAFDNDIEDLTGDYASELELDPSYHTFKYLVNAQRLEANAPKALVFQGSYMNGPGYKFLANGLGEYICVHDYQNVINFPYYYNIFKPDCVIFEVAEYTMTNTYFDYAHMCAMDLNPTFDEILSSAEMVVDSVLLPEEVTAVCGSKLTKIQWNTTQEADYAWLLLDEEYDMIKTETGYTVTVPTQQYEAFKQDAIIAAVKGENITEYADVFFACTDGAAE